ncbi:hypothetical protein C8F04DRAFT_1403694 [Mycena alexandri]|uniref:Uncharacterized protein n=1 Tax=Mycena alexandri TaxID=1745969 RepID=A0AAD6S4V5_9AGAR|nr:hypothetical protein C8F04DRAFT_1403694 [Mycena alexandri]
MTRRPPIRHGNFRVAAKMVLVISGKTHADIENDDAFPSQTAYTLIRSARLGVPENARSTPDAEPPMHNFSRSGRAPFESSVHIPAHEAPVQEEVTAPPFASRLGEGATSGWTRTRNLAGPPFHCAPRFHRQSTTRNLEPAVASVKKTATLSFKTRVAPRPRVSRRGGAGPPSRNAGCAAPITIADSSTSPALSQPHSHLGQRARNLADSLSWPTVPPPVRPASSSLVSHRPTPHQLVRTQMTGTKKNLVGAPPV